MKLAGHIGHGPYSSYHDLCPDMSCCHGIMTENVLKNGQMNVRIVKSQEEMAKIHSHHDTWQGRIQDLWKGAAQRLPSLKTLFGISKGGGHRGRAPSLALLEDPLWNFKRGGGGAHAPCAPPPPESASAWLPGLKIFWYKFFR